MLSDREWKKKYFEKMYAWMDYNSEMHYDLKVLINRRKISYLYKYRTGNDFDIENLNNNQLSAAKFFKFNDPFEFQNYIDSKIVIETYKILTGKDYSDKLDDIEKNTLPNEHEFWNFYNRLIQSALKYKRSYNICCLSEKKDSLLMWSHYANEHKGFNIEYKTTEIFDMHPILCPILYTEKMPSFASGENEIVNFSKLLFTKSLEWEYESEWRIARLGTEDYEFIQTPKPTAIYTGCRIDSELFNKLFDYCKTNNVRLFRGKKNKFKYKLDFEEIILN